MGGIPFLDCIRLENYCPVFGVHYNLPAGEHVLTVNIITFGDQIGVGSRKIKVVK
jgi:hypothetical protein